MRIASEQYRDTRYDAIALRSMPMNFTDKPGLCSPASPGWNKPTTPWRVSPVRIRTNLVLLFSIGTLVRRHDGKSAPGQEQRSEHAHRRRRHTPPRAFPAEGRDPLRVREKEPWFHVLAIKLSRSSGVGGPAMVEIRWFLAVLAISP